ncbi:sensor histidine kinase [uncultured Amnibacterium sp.]|uniref:sensor histidine kinase n=1 Tax=uncultured Amnibacterium sp. TaxID=1631851 RepID=UPI0035CB845C
MTPGQLVLVALLFGLITGGLFTWLLLAAAARGRAATEIASDPLPDGVTATIAALDLPAVVVNGSNVVLDTTPAARALGLVNGRMLAHRDLEVLVEQARRDHAAIDGDYHLHRSAVGGATLDLFARAAPIGAVTVLLLVEDHSDSSRLEIMRRDFVANVSHELKTPIGAVGLLAEAMESAADDPEQVRRFASRLTVEAARLGTITREIIDFSRVQSVDPLLEPEVVAVEGVLAAAVEQNRVLADARGVELVLARSKGLQVLGDRVLLTSAVHNLVANAVQFSPPHGRVGVGARVRDDVVEIAVTDQGDGIGAQDQHRVFERFFRADQARSRATGGTGLGLSIVKHITQNHGGDVRLWSQPGNGSTFTILLPSFESSDSPKAPRRRERETV